MAEKSLVLSNYTAKKTENGNLLKVTGVAAVQKSIENILKTRVGSIPSNPEFGSSLYSYLPQPLDDILVETVQRQIYIDITRWEDRAEGLSIRVSRDNTQKLLSINIEFSYKNEKIGVSIDRQVIDLTNRLIPLSTEEELDASSIFRTDNIYGYIDLDKEVVRIT